MNTSIAFLENWPLPAVLALEAAALVGIAGVIQCWAQNAWWRRALWQTCMLALLSLALVRVTGVDRMAVDWIPVRVSASQPVEPRSGHRDELSATLRPAPGAGHTAPTGEPLLAVPGSAESRTESSLMAVDRTSRVSSAGAEDSAAIAGGASSGAGSGDSAAGTRPGAASGAIAPGKWIGLAWFMGAALLLGRAWLGRGCLWLIRHRSVPVGQSEVVCLAGRLAAQLGIRAPVRLRQSPRFTTPIAFGLIHPTVGLPEDFSEKFSASQQEVILAHELAHLAGRDPAWDLLADSTLAFFWWHPGVWWARLAFRKANEAAADEASLLVADGPRILAECLVMAGRGLLPSRSWGSAGMAGFRSGLGQRVEKLLELSHLKWRRPGRLKTALIKLPLALAVIGLLLVPTAWTHSQSSPQPRKENMHKLNVSWRNSLAAFGLAGAITAAPGHEPNAVVRDLAPVQTVEAGETAALIQRAQRPAQPRQPPSPARPPRAPATNVLVGAQGSVSARLDQIRLEEVRFDGIPLGEVVRELQEISRREDPEGGINFFIHDPEALSQVIIRIELPLKSLSLREALDAVTRAAEHPIHYTVFDYGVAFAFGQKEREVERDRRYMMDPIMAERYGLVLPGMPPPAPPRPDKGLADKLNRIVFEEILFDGLPLGEVLRDLREQAARLDPEGEGVNFLTSNLLPPSQDGEEHLFWHGIDAFGQLLRPAPLPPVNEVIIRFSLPLRNVRLKDVLDAITRVAERSIQYSIEEYGVIFMPAAHGYATPEMVPAFEPQLEVRTFVVDPGKFVHGLEKAFGITLGDEPHEAKHYQTALRELFLQLGVDEWRSKSVFYNELTGVVMVRAAAGDWQVIEAALKTLGGSQQSR